MTKLGILGHHFDERRERNSEGTVGCEAPREEEQKEGRQPQRHSLLISQFVQDKPGSAMPQGGRYRVTQVQSPMIKWIDCHQPDSHPDVGTISSFEL